MFADERIDGSKLEGKRVNDAKKEDITDKSLGLRDERRKNIMRAK